MKTFKFLSIALLSFTLSTVAIAQKNSEIIPVSGNCGMCKNKIEKAAKDAGVDKADWNAEKQTLTVTYAAKKTTAAKIQEAVAGVGYDTRDFRASDDVYEKLHGCCKYERTFKYEKATPSVKEKNKLQEEDACCKKEETAKTESCCL